MTYGDIFGITQEWGGKQEKVDMTPLYFAVSRNMHIPIFDNNGKCKTGVAGSPTGGENISGKHCDDYYKIADLLLKKGANPKAVTKFWFPGWQPVHWASEYSNIDMIELLQKYATKKGDPITGKETYLLSHNEIMTAERYYGEAERRLQNGGGNKKRKKRKKR